MTSIVIMILVGLIASMSIIVKFAPKNQNIIEKIISFQGASGIALLAWSFYILIHFFRINAFDITTTIMLATQFIVGSLLSYNHLPKFIKAEIKDQKLTNQHINFQIISGLLLTAFGVWNLLQIMII